MRNPIIGITASPTDELKIHPPSPIAWSARYMFWSMIACSTPDIAEYIPIS